jgi:hypothetical protein
MRQHASAYVLFVFPTHLKTLQAHCLFSKMSGVLRPTIGKSRYLRLYAGSVQVLLRLYSGRCLGTEAEHCHKQVDKKKHKKKLLAGENAREGNGADIDGVYRHWAQTRALRRKSRRIRMLTYAMLASRMLTSAMLRGFTGTGPTRERCVASQGTWNTAVVTCGRLYADVC